MVEVSCILCGKDDSEPVTVQNGFRVVRCRGCRLVYANPRPAPEELPPLYAEYHGRWGMDEHSWGELMRGVFRESENLLEGTLNGRKTRRLLDVGCGFGSFVKIMQSRGWDGEGIDPSPVTVAAARSKGLPVRLGTIESFEAPSAAYDVVTMFYVLEHLPDPMAALKKVHSLLAPGGTVLLRVPDTTPIVRMLAPFGLGKSLYDPPFHLYDFSPRVLRSMLLAAGFETIRTFPGQSTVPSRLGQRVVSVASSALARGLYAASRGRFLLPGVSKTTVARKP